MSRKKSRIEPKLRTARSLFEPCPGGEADAEKVTAQAGYSTAYCQRCDRQLIVTVVDSGRRRILPYHYRRKESPA